MRCPCATEQSGALLHVRIDVILPYTSTSPIAPAASVSSSSAASSPAKPARIIPARLSPWILHYLLVRLPHPSIILSVALHAIFVIVGPGTPTDVICGWRCSFS